MPAPFVRRMRVINTISAVTLRKIENELILPFDVLDLHHVLDKQISQDAIISMLDSQALKTAIYTGELSPLWDEARNRPLLNRGFDQGWIHRFMLLPFDPICIMLAMRAKLMLDAIDELGHSYNLLRAMGIGWCDLGEISGEIPGDPDSYVPPGINQPIAYPEQYPADNPGDPGYVPESGDPGYIPPSSLTPGDPGYTTLPESPGYIPPIAITPGSTGSPDSMSPPITLDPGPGRPMSEGGPGTPRPSGGINCCLNSEELEEFVTIGTTASNLDLEETADLTVEGEMEGCPGDGYGWLITAGGGELAAETGLEVVYTAPATGVNCPGNTEISLICGGDIVDTLEITINYGYSIEYDYDTSAAQIAREDSELVYVAANNTPLTWSVSGTGFSLEHEETDGVGNVLHADETACGSATITVTGCDYQSVIGYVRCTTGQWSENINGCALGGAPDSIVCNPIQCTIVKTQGKYKQTEKITAGTGANCTVDCSQYCSAGACIGCNTCLTWSCTELAPLLTGYVDCGDWCCGNGGCEVEDGGYCMCQLALYYNEWVCA